MIIVLSIAVVLLGLFVWQAHAKHNTLAAQAKADTDIAKAELAKVKSDILDLETKIKAKL